MKFRDYLEEQLKDPEFKKAYDALESDYAIKQLVIQQQDTSAVADPSIRETPPPA